MTFGIPSPTSTIGARVPLRLGLARRTASGVHLTRDGATSWVV